MILIALMCARVPLSPYNFRRDIKYQTFQMPFYSSFESVANIVFSFNSNYYIESIQSCQTVAMIKSN